MTMHTRGPSDRYRKENREEWRVKFEIWSDELSRSQIDARLGITSHGGWSKGEPPQEWEHNGRLIRARREPYDVTLWFFASSPSLREQGGPVTVQSPVEEHLAWLFAAVAPLRDALITMRDETDARYRLEMVPHFDLDFSWNPGFVIPGEWTALLGALGGKVELDMYVFWGDEE